MTHRSPNRDSKNGGKNRPPAKPDEKQVSVPVSGPSETTILNEAKSTEDEADKDGRVIGILDREPKLTCSGPMNPEPEPLAELKSELGEKSETRNSASTSASPRSHRNANDEPDIHPELTLRQLQNPAESIGRRPGSRSHAMSSSNGFATTIEPLEINEMFDFCGRRSRSRLRDDRRSPWEAAAPAARQRRSSVAAMAGPVRNLETRAKYFTPVTRLTPQSLSAVHYLSISPPRIRITDAHGRTSPDKSGKCFRTLDGFIHDPLCSSVRIRFDSDECMAKVVVVVLGVELWTSKSKDPGSKTRGAGYLNILII